MKKGDYLSALLRSGKTVFSFKDIALLTKSSRENKTKVQINYYVKKGELYPLRRGLYARDKNYNKLELATKIYIPSYVSFQTVLGQEGMNFQFYGQIFVASYLTREIVIDNQCYVFKKIKDSILTNPMGLLIQDSISIASKERAFLDTLYLHKNHYFDNLSVLDWDKVFVLLAIYKNKRMDQSVQELYKNFREDQQS